MTLNEICEIHSVPTNQATKLRLMVTRNCCNRNCPQCCNKAFDTDEDVPLVNGIAHYDEILLTGGEPMLDLEHLVWLIETIRVINPTARIYVDA